MLKDPEKWYTSEGTKRRLKFVFYPVTIQELLGKNSPCKTYLKIEGYSILNFEMDNQGQMLYQNKQATKGFQQRLLSMLFKGNKGEIILEKRVMKYRGDPQSGTNIIGLMKVMRSEVLVYAIRIWSENYTEPDKIILKASIKPVTVDRLHTIKEMIQPYLKPDEPFTTK